MRVTFFGVRGSIPTPSAETIKTGGNTSCVEILCGDTRLVFDAGTGIRLLGKQLFGKGPQTVHLFFSHVHWDHIQGFPFFSPAFDPKTTLHMYGAANVSGTVETALSGQMENPGFPVRLSDLPARLHFNDLTPNEEVRLASLSGEVVITHCEGIHPGGVLAYRVEWNGKAVVYATDTEHPKSGMQKELAALCQGADLLIYDSMYFPEQYKNHLGWGHSTFAAGIDLCRASNVKQLVLFHHDPDQDDQAVEEKERRARIDFENSIAAREGLQIEV